MMVEQQTSTDIFLMMREEGLVTHFQPIVSVRKKATIGYEALTRRVDAQTGRMIPPTLLFAQAAGAGVLLEFDRMCRSTALRNFQPVYSGDREMLLFLNLDVSVLEPGVVGSGHLLNSVQQAGIDPNNVVIEIVEAKNRDVRSLQQFVETYKDYGFLIALDDMGSGHSNLDRIPLIKPDILKIDRALIRNIHQEYYKQVTFKSLVNLSREIGALVIAEGIEREEEAIIALELGADMLQGFLFAVPQELRGREDGCRERVQTVAVGFRKYMIEKIRAGKVRHQGYQRLVSEIMTELIDAPIRQFDRLLRELITRYAGLECLYVLDASGLQVTETICNLRRVPWQRQIVFRPAKKGADHSLKEYFYLLDNTGIEHYTTEPYISLASGNLCITLSAAFTHNSGKQYVVCTDVTP